MFCLNDTATTEIYALSLHDALPICPGAGPSARSDGRCHGRGRGGAAGPARGAHQGTADPRDAPRAGRSEEHTSELQSRQYLVCRLVLQKKTIDYDTVLPRLRSDAHT